MDMPTLQYYERDIEYHYRVELQYVIHANYYDSRPFYDVLLLVLLVGADIKDDGTNTWMRLLAPSAT